jgi:hypothetical protein
VNRKQSVFFIVWCEVLERLHVLCIGSYGILI